MRYFLTLGATAMMAISLLAVDGAAATKKKASTKKAMSDWDACQLICRKRYGSPYFVHSIRKIGGKKTCMCTY